jgi:predicted dehydrogenase
MIARIRSAHVPALERLPEYEIVAMCARSPHTLGAIRSRYPRVPFVSGDYSEVLSHPDVDLVVVTVSEVTRTQLVEDALRAGKNVFCEWPMGRQLSEIKALAELAIADLPAFFGPLMT